MERGPRFEPRELALTDVASRLARGDARAEQLLDAFVAATVYCERPQRPGFLAVGESGEGLIAVFSSLDELAAHAGECDWFAMTGRDLLDLLPSGYDVVLDAASEHALRLRAPALRRRPAIEVTSVRER